MALSNAEKQRRYRERAKARAAKETQPEPVPVRQSFAEYIDRLEGGHEALDVALEVLRLDDIADPSIERVTDFLFRQPVTMIEAIQTLCALISEYQASQIKAELAEIAAGNWTKKTGGEAIERAVRLHERLKELGRKDRHEFASIEVPRRPA